MASRTSRSKKDTLQHRASRVTQTPLTAAPHSRVWVRPAPAPSMHVVGIGGSGGALEALKTFFGAMPENPGLACIVVGCLGSESTLSELRDHMNGLRLVPAKQRQAIEPDHVYLVPPDCAVTLDQGRLCVEPASDGPSRCAALDVFFRSLAEDQRDRAVAIVLSGSGTEGALGIGVVKAQGGLVMAQAPDTAVQRGMPFCAIASGFVDVVDAPAKLPRTLLAYVQNPVVQRAPTYDDQPLDGLPALLSVLRARTGQDLSGYKRGILRRRVARRMGLARLERVVDYADLVRSDPAEPDRLVRDLRIGATSFFRDREAFEELSSSALTALAKARIENAPLRIWVAGCSTGEEAYSIAILLAERLEVMELGRKVRIFATDVDARALQIARAGSYPRSIALDVPPRRLQRFFTQEDDRYTISPCIRAAIVFAVQDPTADPPYCKLDLVICRNVLPAMKPAAQEQLLRRLDFALKPGGYLFLGGTDELGALDDFYAPVSKPHRIYRHIRRAPRAFPSPVVPLTPPRRLAHESPAGAPEPNLVSHLQSELGATKRERQRLVEQIETTNEELRSANEEVLSMNEKLTTLNADLLDKVHELTATNDDLANLLVSTDIATVFLDVDLRVKRFTAAASPILNLRLSDVGRPLSDMASLPVSGDLVGMARSVLDQLASVDREVTGHDGRQFMARAAPYRTQDQAVRGVALTFADVSELRRSHDELRQQADQLRRLASDITLEERRVREQLAKMVHDDVQQLLFSAKLRIDRLAMGRQGPSSEMATALDKARSDLDQAIAAVRSLSVELFPPTLNDGGLGPALSWLADWMHRKYGLIVDMTIDPRAALDHKDRRTLVFESVRELLFNVVKHAGVDRVRADLAATPDGGIAVTVVDDGAGFDPAAVFDRRPAPGWGLFAIRERLTLLGGSFEVDSSRGRGARFTITVAPEAPAAAACEGRASILASTRLDNEPRADTGRVP